MGTDGTFPDFLSCGSRKSREVGDCGIPPLRKRPRKDGAPGRPTLEIQHPSGEVTKYRYNLQLKMKPIKDATRVEQYSVLLREMMLTEEGRECEFNPDWVRNHGWKVVP